MTRQRLLLFVGAGALLLLAALLAALFSEPDAPHSAGATFLLRTAYARR